MTENVQGASQKLIEDLQARIDELNDYNKKMIENYQSSLDELQAVVDRLADKKPFVKRDANSSSKYRFELELYARIELAQQHATEKP